MVLTDLSFKFENGLKWSKWPKWIESQMVILLQNARRMRCGAVPLEREFIRDKDSSWIFENIWISRLYSQFSRNGSAMAV